MNASVNNGTSRDQFPLSPKKIIKKTIEKLIFLTIFLIGIIGLMIFITIINSMNGSPVPSFVYTIPIGSLLIYFVLLILTYIYQKAFFNAYYYNLTDDFIRIKKGVFAPTEITIAYDRIQDVYVDQDILDRIFGLYDVHLSTATITSGMEAHIDGVENTSAEGLRELILKTVSSKLRKNPKPITNGTNTQ